MPRTHTYPLVSTSAWLAAIIAVAIVGVSIQPALAANIVWDPSSDGGTSWITGSNWDGGVAPTDDLSTDIATFDSTTAYNFTPSLDAGIYQSVGGLSFGGTSAVTITLGANTGTSTTNGSASSGSTTITLASAPAAVVGENVIGTGIPLGTFVTGVGANTVTLSQALTGTLATGSTLTFTSVLQVGSSGIAVAAGTTTGQIITAPLVLVGNQTWTNNATNSNGQLEIQGVVNLGSNTLTLTGAANSTISFNGNTSVQAITGSGSIVVNTAGIVNFGAGAGGITANSFTGGVTLDQGEIELSGGNQGGSGSVSLLGTGTLTINGGSISGSGNIGGHALLISGQVWNANWTFAGDHGNKGINMGTGMISLGIAAGTSRTLTTTSTGTLILGGAIVNGTTANSVVFAGTAGIISLTGTSAYTGTTTLSGTTLSLGVANAISGTSQVILNGGTLTTAFNQNLGTATLSLTASTSLTVTGTTTLTFANSSSVAWTGTLTITDTSGTIQFGTDATGLTNTQLADITLNGGAAMLNSSGYLVSAIPEPATCGLVVGLIALVAVIGYRRKVRASVRG